MVAQNLAKRFCPRRVIVGYALVTELDAGLHDECDDSVPCRVEAGFGEGLMMHPDCLLGGLAAGDGNGCVFRGAAGSGYLCSDHIDWPVFWGGFFRRAAQKGRTAGDRFLWKRLRITGAGHARVEMNLGVAFSDVEPDHLCGMDHGSLGAEFLPGVRA